MPILHKFLHHNWDNGFYTENTILKAPYEPEVIFIGSFNHGWPWNPADFFYGRGMYMWTIMANLFQHNGNVLTDRRTTAYNVPSLDEVFEICERARIAFADVVKGTVGDIPVLVNEDNVVVNNEIIWNDHSDAQLELLGESGLLEENLQPIIDYIQRTPSIRHVYFTFKSGHWLMERVDAITAAINVYSSGSIFSPTGNGFRRNLPQFPSRPWSIAHCWVWNGLENDNPINKPGCTHLDHAWLRSKGVNPHNF